MSEKIKKPFYKKWWMWGIAVIILAVAASGGEDEDGLADSEEATVIEEEQEAKEEVIEEKAEEDEEEAEVSAEAEEEAEDSTEEASDDTVITAGTYKIGEDIPSGEYLIFANGMGYIESASDSTGELDSIIFNDNLANDAHAYVTLQDGEYFKLQSAEMYPVEDAPSVKPDDGVYADGMYRVGDDIPAGEYQIILDSSIGMGYYEVASDSTHQLGSIVTNENVEADTYLTVSEGQYLKLQDVKIQN
ncbi:hypothetical protein [Virgibacillus sp. YIM 98842]|jgi:hypothetical protein|uniref:hypothetical protein n=1 Tax=Virgibacillus sp. YIM 98842 TaxID=2663533 RepID=UPI0013DA9636|nr:hypothetical protein [Virgibacillus sp. YIM 98842]